MQHNLKKKSKKSYAIAILLALFSFGTFNSLKAQDVGISSLVVPYDTICGSTNWPIAVLLENYGATAIDFSSNNVTVDVTVSGASSQTFSFVVNSGILNAGANQNVYVTNLADFSAAGTHVFNATATAGTDVNSSNNSMPTAYTFVKPTPQVIAEPNYTICSGTSLTAFTYTSNPPGATFTWSNDNPSVGLAASGTGGRPAFTALNSSGSQVTANITVQATLNGCLSGSLGYMFQIDPLPTVYAGSNQTACAGSSVFFSASATGAGIYNWDFGDGGTSTLLNPTYTYSSPGTYYATLDAIIAATGCMASDTVVITSLAASNGGIITGATDYCDGPNSGSLALAGQTGNVLNWESSVDGGITYTTISNPTLIQFYSNLTTTTIYRAVVQNSFCPQAISTTATIGIFPAPTVNAGPDQAICSGSSVNLTGSIGGSASSGSWSGAGSGTFDNNTSLNAVYTPSTSDILAGSVVLTLTTNTAGPCASVSDIMVLTFIPNSSIYGTVTYSGGNLSSGVNTAYLFKSDANYFAFDTIASSPIDASGNYIFSSIPQGNYLIKVFPDTTVYHQQMVPTYFGNKYLWDSAFVLTHDCYTSSIADITMVENLSGTGPGFISGQIIQGVGFGRAPGGPVPGIDVKLGKNPGGALVASTQTDLSGNYAFSNLPVDSYIIFVDIPGLERDSTYIVNLTATTTQSTGLDYTVDSTMIHPHLSYVGIAESAVQMDNFSVYPNPTKDLSTIEYTLTTDSKVSIEVFNIIGVKVLDVLNTKQSIGLHKINIDAKNNNLNSGIYFIKLVSNGKVMTQRLIITE